MAPTWLQLSNLNFSKKLPGIPANSMHLSWPQGSSGPLSSTVTSCHSQPCRNTFGSRLPGARACLHGGSAGVEAAIALSRAAPSTPAEDWSASRSLTRNLTKVISLFGSFNHYRVLPPPFRTWLEGKGHRWHLSLYYLPLAFPHAVALEILFRLEDRKNSCLQNKLCESDRPVF